MATFNNSEALEHLVDVLIQQPSTGKKYLIAKEKLVTLESEASDLLSVDDSTVTFVMPSESFIEELPPFLGDRSGDISVRILFPDQKKSYFIDNATLHESEVHGDVDYGISFALPEGLEMIEEMPELMKAVLQSGEGGGSCRTPESYAGAEGESEKTLNWAR